MHMQVFLQRAVFTIAAITGCVLMTIAPAPAQSVETCKWGTSPGGTCVCDLRELRPLQGAVGLGEVAKKMRDILDDPTGEKAALDKDPIKVVRGVGQNFFIVDHHHGALAWLKAGHTLGTRKYMAAIWTGEPAKFWTKVTIDHLARMQDKDGVPIAPASLPATLDTMPDDPYRTLAWMLRKADGYCRGLMKPAPPPFAEFRWADWMRFQYGLTADKVKEAADLWLLKKKDRDAAKVAKQQALLAVVVGLAKTAAAKDLPGYRGDIPDGDDRLKNCNPSGGD